MTHSSLPNPAIVATIGPASKSAKTLATMQTNGMTVARLNMSHSTHQEHATLIGLIREATTNIPILLDLSGPRTSTKDGHAHDPTKSNITAKDHHDLLFGIQQGIEWFALSYISSAQDIRQLKNMAQESGASIKVIAKIERAEAVKNLASIVAASDAIMLARGDLGLALGLENLPHTVLNGIKLARAADKPVIVATEVLESMIKSPIPTRAEATDAWLHGYLGSTGVMLSAESALGDHPALAVDWLRKLFLQGRSDRKKSPSTLH